MTNHFHLFLQTTEANLSKAMWDMLRKFCSCINKRHERVGPLFQGRFKSRLVNYEIYGKVLIRYIHQNPCEAQMVKNPEDYPWSSYRNYLNIVPHPEWLDLQNGLLFFDENPQHALKDFVEFHTQCATQKEQERLSNFRCRLSKENK